MSAQSVTTGTGGPAPQRQARRDLKTVIWHADEEKYQKQLEATGGKEDMWQGGDIYYPNPPKRAVELTVEDIAGREGQFTLEKHGFMYARQTSTAMRTRDDLRDSKKIVKEYYPEMVELLKRVTGAPQVKIIHHGSRITDNHQSHVNLYKKAAGGIQPQPAVYAAHLDFSSIQANKTVHSHFEGETEQIMHGRYMIVNAWRPIKTVYRDPFGVASADSVPHRDLVIRKNRWFKEIRESMGIVYNPIHRWYYKFAQEPEDVLIFKQYDNHGRARACPHTAFVDEEYKDSYPRESIEVRAILIWPDHESVLVQSNL